MNYDTSSTWVKPSWMEVATIIVFAISVLLTLNMPLSIGYAFLTFIILNFFSEYVKKDYIHNFLVKRWYLIIAIFIIFYAGDLATTYTAIIKGGYAYETNESVQVLWDNFGYPLGQFIHISMVLSLVTIFTIFMKSKNKILSLFGFMVVMFYLIMEVHASINNLNIIYNHLCMT